MTETAVVESYFVALQQGNVDALPLADEVVFVDPVLPGGRLEGRPAVAAYLASVLPAVEGARVRRFVAQDDYVTVLWELRISGVTVPMCEVFRVGDGLIREFEAYFDPRPLAALATGTRS
jgi:hypothetical protein